MSSSTACQNDKTPSHFPKRTHVISFRLSDEEVARLEAAVAKLSILRSRGDACRALALKWATGRVPEPVPPKRVAPRRKPSADMEALARVVGQLGKIGSNINQVARVANTSGQMPEFRMLIKLAEDIGAIRLQVSAALLGGADDHQGE